MGKENRRTLFLSIMITLFLIIGVLASAINCGYSNSGQSETRQIEPPKEPDLVKQNELEEEISIPEEEPTYDIENSNPEMEDPLKGSEEMLNLVSEESLLVLDPSAHITDNPISSAPPPGSSTYDYVIITTNDIVANSQRLDNFIHMKKFLGRSVLVVTEDDFEGLTGEAPNTRSEKIRQWLIENEPIYNIDNVLLIGDPNPDDPLDPNDPVGDIPMKMTYGLYHSYWEWCEPTDYYYADLTGDWDLDGDGFFGETLPIDHPQSPGLSIDDDFFSILWMGQVMVDDAGEYKFHTYSDDGAMLRIDGNLVIDHWVAHPPTYAEVTLNMTAGKHDIMLAYREDGVDAQITLAWTLPGEYYPAHIPAKNLYNLTGFQGNLTGFYYNNANFTDYKFTRNDPEVNFFWGSGDIGPGGPVPGGDVFVGRIPVYDNNYTQLDEILGKLIDYETDPGDISWRKKILLPMVPHSEKIPAYPLGEHIKYGIADPAGFASYRIYEEDYGVGPEKTPCSCANTVSEWKNGYGMVVWATHGNVDIAAHVIEGPHVSQLDDTKPSFTVQASCANGYAEVKNNLGYSLLKHGAIATISATRGSGHDGGDPTWPLNPAFDVNHNLAYYYTNRLISEGLPAGRAFFETKENFSAVSVNGLRYNLYGDPDCYLISAQPNFPPVAVASGPYSVDEGTACVFDGSASYDPEGDPLEFRWDYDCDDIWDTDWSINPTATFTWGDDYTGQARLEVRDMLGKTGSDLADVTVNNEAPTIEDIEAYILVDFTLRAAGEKWHNVEMFILEDGGEIGYAEVIRYPGSPDDQSVTLLDVKCDVTKVISVKVLFTPMNDPINGQVNGATPCWVNISFEDGGYNRSHHTFNVKHPDTWEWIIGVNQYFVGHEITFESTASDPGSDDLTFTWDWDDGSPITETTYYNDGVNPDLYPSPGGIYPFSAIDVTKHTFTINGNYNVELTVTDDDGSMNIIVIIIIMV